MGIKSNDDTSQTVTTSIKEYTGLSFVRKLRELNLSLLHITRMTVESRCTFKIQYFNLKRIRNTHDL